MPRGTFKQIFFVFFTFKLVLIQVILQVI